MTVHYMGKFEMMVLRHLAANINTGALRRRTADVRRAEEALLIYGYAIERYGRPATPWEPHYQIAESGRRALVEASR